MISIRGLGFAALAVAPLAAAEADPSFTGQFVAEYCTACHAGRGPQGGFHADRPVEASASKPVLEQWSRAADYVAKGVMPPPDVPHPSESERDRFAAAVLASMRGDEGPDPVMVSSVRRLNRIEYLNTLRDLLQIRQINLPVTFPDDNPDLRFDTAADGTSVSPGHLDAFHEVAVDIADRMVPLPGVEQHRSSARRGTAGHDASRITYWYRDGDDTGLYFTGLNIAGWSGALWDKAFIAHASGTYRVRLKVNAEADLGGDGKPFRLGFYAVNPLEYGLPKRALRSDLPLVASVEVPGGKPSVITVDVPLEKNETFHLYCENRMTKEYPPALARETGNTADLRQLLKRYLNETEALGLPTVRFESMEITGPVGPLPRQTEFLGPAPIHLDEAYVARTLLPLAERAYRRPVTEREREELVQAVLEHGADAPSLEYAIHYGIRRILLSPQFLFKERDEADLDDFGLASRLSYFLWSSMPDAELMALAHHGRLANPGTLDSQVRRMVRDPKAQQFVKHFSGQWLGGRKASSVMVCDVRHVWSELIRHGMVRSSEMFLNEILQRNLSVHNFIDSDFTYANEPMRIAWGMPGSEVDLRRLEADQRQSLLWPEPERLDLTSLGSGVPRHVAGRGGALGLTSVLAATADGVESSPILRGVWVLENLLGTPPPPPPPDVPALVTDTSKARTVRETLAAHQNVETCAMCHRSIDPFGLALENYDAVGGWRTAYYQEDPTSADEIPVESSTVTPDGAALDGAAAIKEYLMARPDRFTRTLAHLLLEYATGRKLTPADKEAVRTIVAEEPKEGYGLRDLVARLVTSEVFVAR